MDAAFSAAMRDAKRKQATGFRMVGKNKVNGYETLAAGLEEEAAAWESWRERIPVASPFRSPGGG